MALERFNVIENFDFLKDFYMFVILPFTKKKNLCFYKWGSSEEGWGCKRKTLNYVTI